MYLWNIHLTSFSLISIGLLLILGVSELLHFLKISSKSKPSERATSFFILFAAISQIYSFLDASVFDLTIINDSILLNITGILFFSGGILVRILAFKDLGRFYNVMLTIEPDHKLITTGIYSKIRHPLYLGSILLFIGFPLMLASYGGAVLFFVLSFPVMLKRINTEEKILQAHFKEKYTEYEKHTFKILPFF